MGPIGQSNRARTEDKGKSPAPAPSLAPSAAPVASGAGAPALPAAPSASLPAAPSASAAAWPVQVGAFKSRQQADEVQRRLTEAGFPAVLSPVTLDDGQSRYRVRVGGARSRGEAELLAQQVRARLPLTALVTAN